MTEQIQSAITGLKDAQQKLNEAAKILIDAELPARAQNALAHGRDICEKAKQLEQLKKMVEAKQSE